jgi:hypothetical protein
MEPSLDQEPQQAHALLDMLPDYRVFFDPKDENAIEITGVRTAARPTAEGSNQQFSHVKRLTLINLGPLRTNMPSCDH